MSEKTKDQINHELLAEIEALEQHNRTLKAYLAGSEKENPPILATLRAFKNSLDKISAYILAVYTLKGQKAKITWEPLLENLENAIQTICNSAKPKPRETIQAALNMSEPKLEEVMKYLAMLKQSLRS